MLMHEASEVELAGRTLNWPLPRYNEQLVIHLVLFIFSAMVLNDLGVRTWTKHHFFVFKN